MRNSIFTMMAITLIATLTSVLPAQADCNQDVANAFAKQREKAAYRMKTRQLSPRGLIFMTIDYLLPYKMHQSVKSTTGSEKTELILVGTQSWQTSGLGWQQMRKEETEALNKQFGKAVLTPQKDELNYECLGQIDIEGRTLVTYRGKQGNTDNIRTDTIVIRSIYVDPKTGLPVRSTVARATKPDLAFFKADYSYPDDIVIAPPKDFKPAPKTGGADKDAPPQSKKP